MSSHQPQGSGSEPKAQGPTRKVRKLDTSMEHSQASQMTHTLQVTDVSVEDSQASGADAAWLQVTDEANNLGAVLAGAEDPTPNRAEDPTPNPVDAADEDSEDSEWLGHGDIGVCRTKSNRRNSTEMAVESYLYFGSGAYQKMQPAETKEPSESGLDAPKPTSDDDHDLGLSENDAENSESGNDQSSDEIEMLNAPKPSVCEDCDGSSRTDQTKLQRVANPGGVRWLCEMCAEIDVIKESVCIGNVPSGASADILARLRAISKKFE